MDTKTKISIRWQFKYDNGFSKYSKFYTKRISKGDVKSAGGAAMILENPPDKGFTILEEAHKLPTSHVTYVDGLKIKFYIN